MTYVFDSNSLIDLFNNFYPRRFPSLWEKFEYLVNERTILSVREVYNEIKDYGDHLSEWAKSNKDFFHQPSPEEFDFIAEIFKVKHFQAIIRKKELMKGIPVADPFLIAKAKSLNGIVVTQEFKKPNAAQIPNVCENFNIGCLNLEEFMEKEDWTF